jgi:hypothetical protein
MSDARTGDLGDEDRLPWLEAVEEEEREEGPSAAKMIAWIVIGLLAIAIVVGGLFWAGNRTQPGGGGDGELIAAPEGDYKVKPGDPGGMAVEGEGDTAFAASEGVEPQGQLNTEAVPERPVARPPAPQPQSKAAAAPSRPQPSQAQPKAPTPAPAPAPARPAASGATIQLGAFSSQASATRAWTALSGRFRYLAPFNHTIVPVRSGERTLYRLRASGPDASGICRRLQVAGEDCSLVG